MGEGSSVTLTRDNVGRFAPEAHTAPEVDLGVSREDADALRETLQDVLEGSLPGFGFHTTEGDIAAAVDRLVDSLRAGHLPTAVGA